MRAFAKVIYALDAAGCSHKRTGDLTAEAQCPGHEDRNASLCVGSGEKRVLLKCQAGCETADVVAALGLKMSDLFDEPNSNGNRREIEAVYSYTDEAGKPLFEVCRFASKDFRQRQPDGTWGIKGVRRVPYHLPALIEAVKAGKPVYVVEGEKDVEAVAKAGAVATCNPGGAGKWRAEYSSFLKGAKVAIVADKDEPGRRHAREVGDALHGIAAEVKLGEPPDHKDVHDHLAAGRTLGELVPLRDAEETEEAARAQGRRLRLTAAAAIRSERIRWLWEPRLPLRSLAVIAGEKGLGKSLLTNAHLVAAATRGKLPGELYETALDVLLVTAEDDWRSVVKPRLAAQGADLHRVHRVTVEDDGESLLTLPDDVPLLETEILRLREQGHQVGMIVIDPISAFLSEGTDSHRDASVRRALAPLAGIAERLDLVVLVVAHLTKDDSTRLIHRVSGSGAFVNAARSVLVLAPSPDDPDGEQGPERVLLHVRGNWGAPAPTLSLRVETREVALDDGSETTVGYMTIVGECEVTVEDIQRRPEENTAQDVEEAILDALTDGPRPSREVKAHVIEQINCSRPTVERAAKRMCERDEITIESCGFPRTTTWALASRITPEPAVTSPLNNLCDVTVENGDVTEDSPSSRITAEALTPLDATAQSSLAEQAAVVFEEASR